MKSQKPIVNWRKHTDTEGLLPGTIVWLDLGWRIALGSYYTYRDGNVWYHYNSNNKIHETSFRWAVLEFPDQ